MCIVPTAYKVSIDYYEGIILATELSFKRLGLLLFSVLLRVCISYASPLSPVFWDLGLKFMFSAAVAAFASVFCFCIFDLSS